MHAAEVLGGELEHQLGVADDQIWQKPPGRSARI